MVKKTDHAIMRICVKTVITSTLLLVYALPCLAAQDCKITAFFSPYDNIEAEVVNLISSAEKTVHCSLYGITNIRITKTLKHAVERSVDVKLCLDKTQSAGNNSTHEELRKAGVDIVIKKTAVLEHNKFCVIDNDKVIMGSWNFSNNAQKQDNSDIEISGCPDIVNQFEDAFKRIRARDIE